VALAVTSLGTLNPPVSTKDENSGSNRKWQRVCEDLKLSPDRVIIRQVAADTHGNTSVCQESDGAWKAEGYFRRCRDLGQVFTATKEFVLDAIIVRTGNDTLAFQVGAADAEVFVQFFEVTGEPKVNDNGTGPGQKATHGWSSHPRNDDYLTGVEYKPLRVAAGGRLPQGIGKLTYLKFDMVGDGELYCVSGKRYGFLIGLCTPAPARNFTLANCNVSHRSNQLTLANSAYDGGWGIRREAGGVFPPTIRPGTTPPSDEALVTAMRTESQLPVGDARFRLPPGTNGYPDVDTYRDIEFYVLCKP
jgi:hypothetical protein